ncbi:MAG: 3-keto-5-aminohexanoate cleavage protein [Candidatus Thermoplasmatota archaeon]|jgi:3-keto-5-aminohexanoate cleavage enzyme|nr:3-keto-5-aminohexanoate cleavage protein [Candidatus Thermoplasmatota archaeon]
MEPLIITATPNISWLNPKLKFPKTPEEIGEAAEKCAKAGASIIHIHSDGKWKESTRMVRRRTDAIIQCGMSSLSIKNRMDAINGDCDMISIILGHHDEAFVNVETHKLHTREELKEYAALLRKHGLKPEFEVWHSGHIWNLKYLIERNYFQRPYFSTLFFGWPGGNWSPPILEEYLQRRRMMPDNSIISVSVMGPENIKVLTAAILMGDHVRVGTEDHPFIGNKKAKTEELVSWISDVARSLGRRVASTDEAVNLIGVRRRG